jgi:hypothetical protein
MGDGDDASLALHGSPLGRIELQRLMTPRADNRDGQASTISKPSHSPDLNRERSNAPPGLTL